MYIYNIHDIQFNVTRLNANTLGNPKYLFSCYSTTMFPYFFSLNNLYLIWRLFTLTINTRMAITTSIISMMRRTQTTTTGPTIAPTLTGGTGMTVESKIIATHSKF